MCYVGDCLITTLMMSRTQPRNTGKKNTAYKLCLTLSEEEPISFSILSPTAVKNDAERRE